LPYILATFSQMYLNLLLIVVIYSLAYIKTNNLKVYRKNCAILG